MVGKTVDTVYSWIDESGSRVASEDEEGESSAEELAELFKKAMLNKLSNADNLLGQDEYDWWNEVLESDEKQDKHN